MKNLSEPSGVSLQNRIKRPQVSFIIPVLNGERDIERCLLSVRRLNFPREQCEVFVVDNGSNDKTHKIVKDLGFDMLLVPHVSVAALRNRGALTARGEYLAFIDADVELMPYWLLDGLVAFKNSAVVAAGCFPRIPNPATWVQQTWDLHQRVGQRTNQPVAWLPSMNMLVRRAAFEAIGGFNETLTTAEDVDLCYRLGRIGIILCNPAMEAIHWGEAANLRIFWRKETWRGRGNLKGVLSHGLRWDELPSVGYPLYMLCLTILSCLALAIDLSHRQAILTIINLVFFTLPALFLAVRVSHRTEELRALPKLFLLYLIYGIARAYSIVKESTSLLL